MQELQRVGALGLQSLCHDSLHAGPVPLKPRSSHTGFQTQIQNPRPDTQAAGLVLPPVLAGGIPGATSGV